MKPPICCIDHQPLNPKKPGDLVNFRKTERDEEWDRMAEQGLVGHPPYAEWFCHKHIKQARSLTHLTLEEAMKVMKG